MSHAAATSCSPHDVPQGVVARSCRVLFFLLSSSHLILLFPSFLYPFWTFPFPLTRAVRACVRACLRARTQVRTKGIWVYNATEAIHVVVNIQLRGNVAPRRVAFLVYVIAAVASRETPCAHINTYTCTYRTHRTYYYVFYIQTGGYT